ncbi:MAG: Arc family DNA-binding protein [Spirochaetes bacterium]|nr:Arc family DNA-binding protein [Spirochaetota bacterium]
MATITVKNIPDNLYKRLKESAEMNLRSINSEIIKCIENSVACHRLNSNELIENASQLRKLTVEHPINDDSFNHAKTEGRL